MDLEASQIDAARTHAAAKETRNLRFEVGSIYQLPFPDNSFDAVFAHALFEHLGEPEEAFQEVRRVLRPGGIIGVSSPDWSGNLMAPRDADAERAVDVFKAIQQRNGGNPYVGRELGELMQETGFSRVALAARYDCYEDVPLVAELLAQKIEEGVGKQIVAGPGLSRAEVGQLCLALRQWARRPVVLFGQSFVEAIGYK
jgi:SAM-dependent methyltransferase